MNSKVLFGTKISYMTMKEKKYDDDSIHDEVLEEIEKKDKKAD